MLAALFLPFVEVACPGCTPTVVHICANGGCVSRLEVPVTAPASLAGGADDLWLILGVVLAFGAGTLVQIWMPRRLWIAAAHLGLGLTALSLAIFEGVEAGVRVLHVELPNLFTPTALLAGYFMFLCGAIVAALSASVLFISAQGAPHRRIIGLAYRS
ncbi:MAG: hypothetical protein WCB85_13995 [Candidatus Dormiibacterota bacterium]